MAEQLKKEDIKEIFTEAFEPFTGSIKEDFNKIDGKLTNLAVAVADLTTDMKEIKPDVKETKNTINNLFNRIDKFLAMLEKLDQEFAAMKLDINRMKQVIKEKLGVDLA